MARKKAKHGIYLSSLGAFARVEQYMSGSLVDVWLVDWEEVAAVYGVQKETALILKSGSEVRIPVKVTEFVVMLEKINTI